MKKYITWKAKKINDALYEHPNTNNRVDIETGGAVTFIETPFQTTDGRFISVVEYADDCTEENIEYFRTLDSAFEFTFIDETTANTLLLELYNGDVTVSDFIFTDNRPYPDEI